MPPTNLHQLDHSNSTSSLLTVMIPLVGSLRSTNFFFFTITTPPLPFLPSTLRLRPLLGFNGCLTMLLAFLRALELGFALSKFDDPIASFCKLTLTQSLQDHLLELENLDLPHAIALAKLYEGKHHSSQFPLNRFGRTSLPPPPLHQSSISPSMPLSPLLPTFSTKLSIKRLTEVEMVTPFLHLPSQPTQSPLRVMLGNGKFLSCSSFRPQITLTLDQQTFSMDLYPSELSGTDVVLGVHWLSMVSPFAMDFNDSFIGPYRIQQQFHLKDKMLLESEGYVRSSRSIILTPLRSPSINFALAHSIMGREGVERVKLLVPDNDVVRLRLRLFGEVPRYAFLSSEVSVSLGPFLLIWSTGPTICAWPHQIPSLESEGLHHIALGRDVIGV
ncbi:hypothetical protein V8G54_021915 [Vigna mungo]|uniref:Uncharacterized protein n=1 Tax=Vigna mungo TaxID=3915 RepID=A0AAQ3RXT6_VIGMU